VSFRERKFATKETEGLDLPRSSENQGPFPPFRSLCWQCSSVGKPRIGACPACLTPWGRRTAMSLQPRGEAALRLENHDNSGIRVTRRSRSTRPVALASILRCYLLLRILRTGTVVLGNKIKIGELCVSASLWHRSQFQRCQYTRLVHMSDFETQYLSATAAACWTLFAFVQPSIKASSLTPLRTLCFEPLKVNRP
jgi:hypothetical protein